MYPVRLCLSGFFIVQALLMVNCGPNAPSKEHSFIFIEEKKSSCSEALFGDPGIWHIDMSQPSLLYDSSEHSLYSIDSSFSVSDTSNLLILSDITYTGVTNGAGGGEQQIGKMPYAFLIFSYHLISLGRTDSVYIDTIDENERIKIRYRDIERILAVGDSMTIADSVIDTVRNSTNRAIMWIKESKEATTFYNHGKFTNRDIHYLAY